MRIIDGDTLIRKYIDTDIEKFSNSDVKIVLENLKQNILNMPTIETSTWIPCSERHPKDGRYYVTRIDYVTNTIFTDILWYEKGIWWNRQYTGDFAVIAWMPLPKPYEEVKENE